MVEVKPPAGGNQYFWQWCKEIESFLQAEEDSHKPLYFLAIGRIEQSDAEQWASQLLSPSLKQLKGVAALKWDAVTAQLVELMSEETELALSKQDRRIIQDMLDGLSLYGQQISPFKWSDLITAKLPTLSLNPPLLGGELPLIPHQTDEPLSMQSLLTHSLGRLDLSCFQSALKE